MVCNLPNKCKLHIVQLHVVVQKYMDIAFVKHFHCLFALQIYAIAYAIIVIYTI